MIKPIPDWYQALFDQYSSQLNTFSHIYIALSAGIDSNMLLHWLATYKDRLPPITAIHVNHKWHGEYSFIWADFAKQRAEYYQIPFIYHEVDIDISDKGAEASGREARYIKFAETMINNSVLLVAHHRSDQVETLLFRLIRGSGLQGLGGIRPSAIVNFGNYSINILRPFLEISKKTLYETGEMLNIPWMEDYSNHENDVARNQIRNSILPEVERFFPYYEQTIFRSSLLLQEAFNLQNEIAQEDSIDILDNNTIHRENLLKLSVLRQKNVLRYWLNQYQLQLEKRQFDEFFTLFFEQEPTSKTLFTITENSFRYFDNKVYRLPKETPKTTSLHWDTSNNMPPESFWQQFSLKLIDRINGEKFHPIYRDKPQTIKKILQERHILPWERENMVFLIDQNTNDIIWIEHIGLHKKYQNFCEPIGIMPKIIRE